MSSAHLSRREQARFWVVAQVAKAVRDFGKSQIDVPLDVLGEYRHRLDLGDDALDIRPQVPRIGLAAALARAGERLARIAGSEDMNASAPRLAVEGFEIVPHRRRLQGLVLHPRHESGRSVGFPLDETHSAVSGLGDREPQFEPAVAGAERKAAQLAVAAMFGMNSHKGLLLRQLDRRSEKGSKASAD